mgnify:FL=1
MNSLKQFLLLHKNKMITASKILLICLISLIAWQLENRFFSIFIIVFFIAALFLERRRYFILIVTTILIFITFNTLTFENLANIKKIDLPFIQHPKQYLIDLFSPDTGKGFFPTKILTMSSLIHSNGLETYQLSDELTQDTEILQRIVGEVWPIRLESSSLYYLIGIDEVQLYQHCAIIDQKEDVILVNCH